jgi:hypothetical protein
LSTFHLDPFFDLEEIDALLPTPPGLPPHHNPCGDLFLEHHRELSVGKEIHSKGGGLSGLTPPRTALHLLHYLDGKLQKLIEDGVAVEECLTEAVGVVRMVVAKEALRAEGAKRWA